MQAHHTIDPLTAISDFKNFALSSAGIELPADIIPDGQLHRFKITGEKSGKLSGAYVLHLDNLPAGYVQDFRTDTKLTWSYSDPDYTPAQLTPEQREQQAETIRQNKELTAQAEAEKHAAAAKKALFIWNKSTPLTDSQSHPYLVKKGIKGAYSVRINNYQGNTSLVIPVGSSNAFSTLQFINADGSKRFLPDGKKKGCYSILNKMERPRIIAIGEGFATVACILDDRYSVTNGVMGVMALDAGNLEAVAVTMREKYPSVDILIFGDKGDLDDKGEKAAQAAAKACYGYCVLPPIAKGDFNDYLTSGEMIVALGDLIQTAIDSHNPPPLDSFSTVGTVDFTVPTVRQVAVGSGRKQLFTPISELLKARKCISWVIRDYLPLNSTCMLYGESGAGKSFLALDMALHVATGKEWQGQKTKQGAVFYIAGEGQTGITARCHAWALHHGVNLENVPFYITDGAVVPTDEAQLDDLTADITRLIESTGEQPLLIFFDTLARCFDGDENSSRDASRYIKAMDKIKQRFKCCVVTIHHTGKDTTKGGRGSSAFKGAWDMEHSLSVKDGGIKQLETTKAKDIAAPMGKFFKLESVPTDWLDDDGEVIYSAVMIDTEQAPSKGKPLNKRQQDVLTELYKATEQHGIAPTDEIKALFPDSPQNIPAKVVHIDKWRALAYKVIDADSTNTKKIAFRDIRGKLKDVYKIGHHDDYYWVC